MQKTRLSRRLAVAALIVSLLAGVGVQTASADAHHNSAKRAAEEGKQRGRRNLEDRQRSYKRSGFRVQVLEAKGTVTAVTPAAGTFELAVGEANLGSLRGTRATFTMAPQGFVGLGETQATLADIHVGDRGKITGLTDPSTGKPVAYIALFTRPLPAPPAPARLAGPVATLDATLGTFSLTVGGSSTPTAFTLGSPSIVTLNNQAATLADVKAGDRGEVTAVPDASTGRLVAYVAKFTRKLPPAPAPVRVEGIVASTSPSTNSFALTVKGLTGTVTMASPSIIVLNNQAATLADVHVNDRATVTGIANSSGNLVAFLVSFSR